MFSIVETKKADDLDFLQDVVSELLAVGKVDEKPFVGVIEPLKRETTKSPNITRSIGSIENFFEDIKSQAESYSKSFDDEDNRRSEESEGENEVFSTEGNDSGIEDESMPGVTKESSHKRKSSSKNRKHHNEEGHRSSRRHSDKQSENDRLKRSDSEPKKSKKHSRKQDQQTSNTNSLPRSDKYKAKANGDVTIRIDGHDYNSTNIGRHGRTKERRSEPIPTKPYVDPKAKTKTRKSEPIPSYRNRAENDYEGGLVGNHQRAMTDGHVNKHHRDSRSKSPDKKERSRSKSPRNGMTIRSNEYKNPDQAYRNGSSAQISYRSNEYTRDTNDGKHRVYVQPRSEDPGSLPKKEKIRDFDNNIRSMVRGREDDSDLVEKLGVSPDILKLLREEEKFWHRQQELKEWRKSKDSHYNRGPLSPVSPPPVSPPPYTQRSSYEQRPNESNYTTNGRNADVDAEILREAAENRLALQAEKLMKVRAEQERILKSSRENLLDDPDHARPPPRNYNKSYSSSSGHSHPSVSNKSNPTSPTTERTYPTYSNISNLQNNRNYNRADQPPHFERTTQKHSGSERSRSSSQDQLQEETKVYPTSTSGALTDNEVFNDTRQQQTVADHRGYFSDDAFKDNTITKTHLARPTYRQAHQVLPCMHCSKIIKDNRLVYVDGQDYFWHSACFRCVVCRCLLNDNNAIRVRIVGMKLHCRYCTSARSGKLKLLHLVFLFNSCVKASLESEINSDSRFIFLSIYFCRTWKLNLHECTFPEYS